MFASAAYEFCILSSGPAEDQLTAYIALRGLEYFDAVEARDTNGQAGDILKKTAADAAFGGEQGCEQAFCCVPQKRDDRPVSSAAKPLRSCPGFTNRTCRLTLPVGMVDATAEDDPPSVQPGRERPTL